MATTMQKPHSQAQRSIDIRVISLGAGVQSTAMLLMALDGLFGERPDCAIFADTGAEPQSVYDHLAWLQSVASERGFPVHIVQRSNLRTDAYETVANDRRTGTRWPNPPLRILNTDGTNGLLRRKCTQEYKIIPVNRKIRELVGGNLRGKRVEVWMGISTDEAHRMKPSRIKAIQTRWPLIEAGLSREACLKWVQERYGVTAPKSACTFCPYRSDASWLDMKKNDPVSWQDAVTFDRTIRHLPEVRGQAFLHRALIPLDQVVFKGELAERGDLFGEECEGMCGL